MKLKRSRINQLTKYLYQKELKEEWRKVWDWLGTQSIHPKSELELPGEIEAIYKTYQFEF